MRRALGITLGIVLLLASYAGVSFLTDNWEGLFPSLVKGLLTGAVMGAAILLAARYDVWGYGTLVRRREQERRDRRNR